MQLHNVEQKSPEWFALRVAHPFTSSEAQAIAAGGKGLETLVMEKLTEKYSSANKENFETLDTKRGIQLEPQAREIYSLETGIKCTVVGFITNEEISKLGGSSPDSFADEDGQTEIKCPSDKVYLEYLLSKKIDSGYMWQMQHQLLFSGKKWCDYVVFNPNYDKPIVIVRVFPDALMQQKIRTGLAIGEQMYKEKEALIIKALS